MYIYIYIYIIILSNFSCIYIYIHINILNINFVYFSVTSYHCCVHLSKACFIYAVKKCIIQHVKIYMHQSHNKNCEVYTEMQIRIYICLAHHHIGDTSTHNHLSSM